MHSFRSQFQKNYQPAARDTVPGENKKRGALDNQLMLDRQLNLLQVEETMKGVEQRIREMHSELTDQDWRNVVHAHRNALINLDRQLTRENVMRVLADVQLHYHLLQEKAIPENDSQIRGMERSLGKAAEELGRHAEAIQMDVEHTIAENLHKVKSSLEKAQMELEQLKSFTNDLEKDGLIQKGGKYTIDIKKGDLYINGVKQPDRVVKKYREKYRQYFEGGKDGFMLRSNYPASGAEVI